MTAAPQPRPPALDGRAMRLRVGAPRCVGRLGSETRSLAGDFTGAIHVGPKEPGWGIDGLFDYAGDQWPRETRMRTWSSRTSRPRGGGLVLEGFTTDEAFPYQAVEAWRAAEIVLEAERTGTTAMPSIPEDRIS